MPRYKKNSAAFTYILLIVVLINAIIIKSAYVNDKGLYWLLILSAPILLIAIFYARKRKNNIFFNNANKNQKLNIDNNKMPDDNLYFSNNNKELTVLFGNSYCTQPYRSSIVCHEAIPVNQHSNFIPGKKGSLKENFLQKFDDEIYDDDDFEKNIIWQIGPGYPGCSSENYNFNPQLFRANAMQSFVKMIELKLVASATEKKLFTKKDVYTNNLIHNKYEVTNLPVTAMHTAFSTAEGLAIFLDSLRQLSGKKPVGIRLSITNKKEFHEICYAFRKTGIIPDYIVIEDCDKEDNSSLHSLQSACMPLYEALLFVSKTLEMYGLEKEIKIIAVTAVNSAFDVLKLQALGADAISMKNYAEAVAMQTGTSSKKYINDLHNKIIRNTAEIMKACGFINLKDITLPSLLRRLDSLQSKAFSKIYDEQVETDPELKIVHPFKVFPNEEKRQSLLSS